MEKAIVFGGGVSGLAAKKLLEKNDYVVYLVDDKTGIHSDEALKLLDEVSLFIKSPGIPYVELVKKAQEKNIEIIDEIELSYRELKKYSPKTKIIAVTGTNGKSTTTAKIAEMINFAEKKAVACGNIGKAFAEVVLECEEEKNYLDFVVIELSSFQLENLKEFKADVCMLINLTPDHLDRYASVDEYYDVKFNIGINQTEKEFFIVNAQDYETQKRLYRITGNLIEISKNKNEAEGYVSAQNNKIIFAEKEIMEVDKFSLKGQHNLENMLFIIATGKLIGLEEETIRKFAYTAKPLEHRLEDFLRIGNTIFINDSKGTNIDSTKFAVETYEGNTLICGGYNKGFDLLPLAELIKKHSKEVYLIGANRKVLKEKLAEVNFPEDKIYDVETIENVAVELKNKLNLNENNVILFSPATSSYDQFKNYEERGRRFKDIIRKTFSN